MDLYYIILTLFLLVLILITCCLKQKSVMYFIIIIFLALVLNKCILDNKKVETFAATQAGDQLINAVRKDREIDALQNQVSNLQRDIKDLTDVVRVKTLNNQLEKNSKTDNYNLLESQKSQDRELGALEAELDVLLKLYRKEIDDNDKNKYKSIPIHSSCKVKDEGLQYVRDYDDEKLTSNDIQTLENSELLKNAGIDSESATNLLSTLKQGSLDDKINMAFNFV